MTFLPLAQVAPAAPPCGVPDEASWLCEVVLSSTGSPSLARAADVLIARPVTVVLILLAAWVLHRLARRAIRQVVRRVNEDAVSARHVTSPPTAETGLVTATRRTQRAEALGTLLASVAGAVIWVVAGLMALAELGLNLGPLLAGAGVLGIAIGFGAQSLVRDFLSGIFMLVEDQYGVGDVVDTGEASGTVERVSLRSTRLRGVDGVVWHVPNGEIRRIGNKSQEWSRALLDVPVPYDADVPAALALIQREADGMVAEPRWGARILSRPEVWGVERFDATSLAVRIVMTTRPLEQWAVSRELRRRLIVAFGDAGIDLSPVMPAGWLPPAEAVASGPGAAGGPSVSSAGRTA